MKWTWTDGPVICTLLDESGAILLGQLVRTRLGDLVTWGAFDYIGDTPQRVGSREDLDEAKSLLETWVEARLRERTEPKPTSTALDVARSEQVSTVQPKGKV